MCEQMSDDNFREEEFIHPSGLRGHSSLQQEYMQKDQPGGREYNCLLHGMGCHETKGTFQKQARL